MGIVTVFYALLFYAATAVLVVGVGLKAVHYAKAPAPLKIPTTPAPVTQWGVVLRMAREVFFFQSLFKANKWIWLLGIVFHGALALVLLRHFRYFTEPVWTPVALIQDIGMYAGFGMVLGLAGLWARRFLVERIRYISCPSDHLMLLLLVLIGTSGLSLRYLARTDIIAVKAFFIGLMRFDWQPLPTDGFLLFHLALVACLMIVFPFSKLLHAPGVFFSPTRNQADNPRERRHLANWAAAIGGGGKD
ncbi:MAG: nitrate reductase [Rhodospirillaceae bacterium]|jgi:nitrate reductase gamma subunit|nr:nitrate reductase [Rhodospirillaceae bacterium]|tara:strand:- start:4136 stop:4876 length:741 start_codon:yes stop_codon:yes gene_type:complete